MGQWASWNPSPSSERTQHPKYQIPQWMKRYSIMCRCRHSQRLELAFAATSWFAQLPRMVSWLFTTIITDTHINFPFRQLHVWDGLNHPVYPVLSYCGLKILWVANTGSIIKIGSHPRSLSPSGTIPCNGSPLSSSTARRCKSLLNQLGQCLHQDHPHCHHHPQHHLYQHRHYFLILMLILSTGSASGCKSLLNQLGHCLGQLASAGEVAHSCCTQCSCWRWRWSLRCSWVSDKMKLSAKLSQIQWKLSFYVLDPMGRSSHTHCTNKTIGWANIYFRRYSWLSNYHLGRWWRQWPFLAARDNSPSRVWCTGELKDKFH